MTIRILRTIFLFSFLALLVSAASYTSPPSGAVIVRQSGTKSGEYSTVQAAVNSLDSTSDKTIFIYPGTYNEQVLITRSGPLTIRGYTTDTATYTANQVTITNNVNAATAGNNDSSGTLRVKKNNFKMYNVNVKNTIGKSGGQALALSAYGTQQGYYACSFTGYQDTLMPNEGTQFFGGCYIEGATDFIFGQRAQSYFYKNIIAPVNGGYITANGRDSTSNPSNYVFDSCTIQAASSAPSSITGTVYLGRPWRAYARTVFKFCSLSNIVAAAGWHEWGSAQPDTTHLFYGEYKNTGPGAWNSKRVSFATNMSSDAGYTISDVLGSGYASWVDMSYYTGSNGGAATTTTKATTTTTIAATTTTKVATTIRTTTRTTTITVSNGGGNCAAKVEFVAPDMNVVHCKCEIAGKN
ncbi:hypothetical protein HDV00_000872 [Rhizophlyctis rosea]|nr:hypothetical protein HDV00_000872 [Rhizophlyctis rosea]